MKKGLILITVILFGLILALRYVEEKSGRSDSRSGAKIQTEKGVEGVALPEDRDKNLPIGDLDIESYDSGLVSYGDPITLSEGEESLSKACEKGSVKDIFIAHGKIWGYGVADSRCFNFKESKAIYNRLTQYTACKSAALRSINYCNKLPARMKGVCNIPEFLGPRYKCIESANSMLYYDFMAGNIKSNVSCLFVLSGDNLKGMPVSDEVFCKIASTGLENICPALKKNLSDSLYKECFQMFPRKLSDCDSDKNCKDTYMIYQGIKTKDYKKCPDEYKEICQAYLSKSIKPCEEKAKALSKTYCNFLKRVNKASGNAPGMSDDDIKQHAAQVEEEGIEKRKLKAEERIHAEKERKEQEKVIKEVNDRVKKLLGKK